MDPLSELEEHLVVGTIPDEWKQQHAPDRDLAGAWGKSWDAFAMLQLSARTADACTVVQAACACARTTLPFLPAHEQRPL